MGVASVAFGVTALVLAGGFIEYVLWAMREDTIHSRLGHMQLARAGYWEEGAADPFRFLLAEQPGAVEQIRRLPDVVALAPRLGLTGMISRDEASLAFMGEGVDPTAERALSRAMRIVAGSDLSLDDPNGILLGEGLAANLGAQPGDPVVLLVTTRGGSVNALEARVRGVFATPIKAYDESAVRLPLAGAQTLLRTRGTHVWTILLADTARTPAALADAGQLLARTGLEVTPWTALADAYNKTSALFRKQVAVVQLIIAVIVVLSISNTMQMMVMERTGEIGTTLALGSRRRDVLIQYLAEGAILGLLGGVLGLVLGYTLAEIISHVGIPMPAPPGMSHGYLARIRLTGAVAGSALALAVTTALFASLYPAWHASRLQIVDALRHNR